MESSSGTKDVHSYPHQRNQNNHETIVNQHQQHHEQQMQEQEEGIQEKSGFYLWG
jgi:hypothetical protein